MKQKTEIEIEISETLAYVHPTQRREAFCLACESLVEMATPQLAAILSHSTEREIFRLVESGKVHFSEIDSISICLNSLIIGEIK